MSQAAAQVSTLVRDQLVLAKLELAEKGKRADVGGWPAIAKLRAAQLL